MPLLVLLAVLASVTIGDIVAVRNKVDLRWKVWGLAIAAIGAARLVYMWQFHLAYFAAPWRILDLRDGGWSAEGGLVGLWLRFIWMARRHPALKRPIRAAALTGTLLWGCGAVALAARDARLTGVELPSLALSTQSGTAIDLRTLRGKPLVVNLWATWCPPCNREMPVLAQAQADRPDVRFVFVNQGENAMTVATWIGRQRLTLHNVLIDPRQQAGAVLGQRAFPTTYFFDAGGHLVDTRLGELSPAVLAEKLSRIAPPSR